MSASSRETQETGQSNTSHTGVFCLLNRAQGSALRRPTPSPYLQAEPATSTGTDVFAGALGLRAELPVESAPLFVRKGLPGQPRHQGLFRPPRGNRVPQGRRCDRETTKMKPAVGDRAPQATWARGRGRSEKARLSRTAGAWAAALRSSKLVLSATMLRRRKETPSAITSSVAAFYKPVAGTEALETQAEPAAGTLKSHCRGRGEQF